MSSPKRLTASVIVVTKDRPQMLRRLLASLARQSVAPDEVVVIDNNSTASYAEVFREFAPLLPLRTFVETTPGIPAARTRGIQEATGDLVLFTDDDCEADPDWVRSITEPFYRDPHIGAVGGEILSPNEPGTLVEQFCNAETILRIGRDAAEETRPTRPTGGTLEAERP